MSPQQSQPPDYLSSQDASASISRPDDVSLIGQSQLQTRPSQQAAISASPISHPPQYDLQTGPSDRIPGEKDFSEINFSMDDFFFIPNTAGGSGESYPVATHGESNIALVGLSDNTHTIPTALPYFPDDLSSRPESHGQSVSADDLATLHNNYFTTIYHALPWLNQERFVAELALTPESPPLLSLSYGIALIGCTISPQYDHLQQPCYHMARKYAEECEREEEEGNLASLNLFQALLFIIRHEIRGRRPLRAWVTIGRAIRLSRILGLHQMDCGTLPGNELSELRSHLAPTDDELLLEERRRSFWALYMV